MGTVLKIIKSVFTICLRVLAVAFVVAAIPAIAVSILAIYLAFFLWSTTGEGEFYIG